MLISIATTASVTRSHRTNIHSCDFSSGSYTYVDEGDKELKSFSVEHDQQFRIPFIKQALAAAGGSSTIFASPWSPPAFMKDNNNMLRGGKLKPEFYQSWANYFAKFIKAYRERRHTDLGRHVFKTSRWRRRSGSRAFSQRRKREIF